MRLWGSVKFPPSALSISILFSNFRYLDKPASIVLGIFSLYTEGDGNQELKTGWF